MLRPPSTIMVWPVIYEAASDAKNIADFAISYPFPNL